MNNFKKNINKLTNHQLENCRKIEKAGLSSFSQTIKMDSAQRAELLKKISNN